MTSTQDMNSYCLDDLLLLMRYLRTPERGCPWDLEQSFHTIVASTIEEAYEVVDAIENENFGQLKEELGDLLFQIVFYSQLGEEREYFNFHEIVDTLTQKLILRHPHVFPSGKLQLRPMGETSSSSEIDVKGQWEAIKQQERKAKGWSGILDDVPAALPALTRAEKLQKRASQVGFDWPNAMGALEKIKEEVAELEEAIKQAHENAVTEEMGDILFSVVNLCRHLKCDPETTLRHANTKFTQRFQFVEKECAQKGRSVYSTPIEELEEFWQKAKQQARVTDDATD